MQYSKKQEPGTVHKVISISPNNEPKMLPSREENIPSPTFSLCYLMFLHQHNFLLCLDFIRWKDKLNDNSKTTAIKSLPWLNFSAVTFWKLSQTKERFIKCNSGIFPVPTDHDLLYLKSQSHCWLLNKLLRDISVIVHFILTTTKERVSDPLRWDL